MQLSVQPDYYGYIGAWAKLQSNYELAGGSLLCKSGHARRVPEVSIHVAQCVTHGHWPGSPVATVHKVAVRAANTFSLNRLRSLSRRHCNLAFAQLFAELSRRGHSIIVKYLNALI